MEQGCRTAGIGCIDCKKLLFAQLERKRAPIRERAQVLRADPGRIDEILAAGADRARAVAAATMAQVADRIGLTQGGLSNA